MVVVPGVFFKEVEFPIHLLARGAVQEADHRPDRRGTLEVRVIEKLDPDGGFLKAQEILQFL